MKLKFIYITLGVEIRNWQKDFARSHYEKSNIFSTAMYRKYKRYHSFSCERDAVVPIKIIFAQPKITLKVVKFPQENMLLLRQGLDQLWFLQQKRAMAETKMDFYEHGHWKWP